MNVDRRPFGLNAQELMKLTKDVLRIRDQQKYLSPETAANMVAILNYPGTEAKISEERDRLISLLLEGVKVVKDFNQPVGELTSADRKKILAKPATPVKKGFLDRSSDAYEAARELLPIPTTIGEGQLELF